MDMRRSDIVSRNRAEKAKRLIAHLDRHFARPVTAEDLAGWREVNWRRAYSRAGERWNDKDPWATPNTVLALLGVRERLAASRQRRLVPA